MTTLVLLPHQDDEIFSLTGLSYRISKGERVVAAFLTDGSFLGHSPEVRDNESRACLAAIGILEPDLHFLHRKTGVRDMALVGSLALVWPQLLSLAQQTSCSALIMPAWEGGHPDHDAAYLLGTALARRFPSARAEQVFMYNGAGTSHPFFRTMSPLAASTQMTGDCVPYRAGIATLASIRRFPSQWRSLWPLAPGIAKRLLLERRDATQEIRPDAASKRPPGGSLFYERLGRMSWARFVMEARPFVPAHLSEVAMADAWVKT